MAHTLCTFYLRSQGDYVRLYEIMHLSLGAWGGGSPGPWVEGGSKGVGRQDTRILHIHTHD